MLETSVSSAGVFSFTSLLIPETEFLCVFHTKPTELANRRNLFGVFAV